jgi:hypothetical protein
MQPAEQRALRHALLAGHVRVEPAEPLMLDHRVAEGVSAVLCAVCDDVVLIPLDLLTRLQLDDVHDERHAFHAQVHRVMQDAGAALRRPQSEGRLPALQSHGAQQAGHAEEVVGVHVREEDVVEGEAGAEAHHLPLRALAAVEQQRIALPLDG